MYEAVWPRGKKKAGRVSPARRLDTPSGKTIAFLWNRVFRGDLVFPIIEKKLAEQFPGVKFVGYDVFGSTHGPHEMQVVADLRRKLAENGCDAAISGMGC
ncbi:MAG: hypothetical protein HYY32_06495 [Chloroflexi bacterium]|nr:hypothetical protein [Chloroflexota bacterium]